MQERQAQLLKNTIICALLFSSCEGQRRLNNVINHRPGYQNVYGAPHYGYGQYYQQGQQPFNPQMQQRPSLVTSALIGGAAGLFNLFS